MKKYVLLKDEKIVGRKPYEFEDVLPKQYLTNKSRWTTNIDKARVFTDPSFSVADRLSNKYLYKYEEL